MPEMLAIKDFIILRLPDNINSKLIIPDIAKNTKLVEGTSLLVIKIGKKCIDVKVGDRLIVDPQAIVPFAFEKKQYFLTREENVGAIIR